MKKPEGWPPLRLLAWLSGPIGSVMQWVAPMLPDWGLTVAWAVYAPYLWSFSAAFMFAEMVNPDSWPRKWLRWRFRLFDVSAVIPISVTKDKMDLVAPEARLVFARTARDASLMLEVGGCMTPGGNIRQPASYVYETNRTFVVGETYKLALAFIPLKTYPPGPLPPARYSNAETGPLLVAGSVNVLTIVLRTRWRSQSYKIHLRSLMADSNTHGRFFCMSEDYDPFRDGNAVHSFT